MPTDINQDNFNQAKTDLQLNDQEQYLYQKHLSNLYGNGGQDNPDGSRSSLYASVEKNAAGSYSVIPTIWNGNREVQQWTRPADGKVFDVPNDVALSNVASEGWDKYPTYPDPNVAEARYNAMHDYMEKDTVNYFNSVSNTR